MRGATTLCVISCAVLLAPLGCKPRGCADGGAGVMGCFDGAAFARDVRLIARPRVPGSAHWQAVQDLCAERLAQLGYEVERQAYGTGTNVVGTRRGGVRAGERVLVSAHYDHLAGCAGADDNAAGVAGVLEIARLLGTRSHDATLVVACWDEEERGFIGSRAYARRAQAQGEVIAADLTFDCIAYRSAAPGSQRTPPGFAGLFPDAYAQLARNQLRGDFIALVGDDRARPALDALAAAAARLELPAIALTLNAELTRSPALGDLRRSDHAAFWDLGMPAVLLTDTANFRYPGYHCGDGPDTVDRLDLDFAGRVVRITAAAAEQLLGRR